MYKGEGGLLFSHSFYRLISIPDNDRREAVYFQQADSVALVEGTVFEFVIEKKGFALNHFAEMVKIIFLSSKVANSVSWVEATMILSWVFR